MNQVEALIVGAGPAGAACAVQAARDGLSLALVGDEPVGGLVRAARRLDNLPGFPGGVCGERFAELLAEQLALLGIAPRRGRAVACERRGDGVFVCRLRDGEEFAARALVLAVGTRPILSDAPGLSAAAARGRAHSDPRPLPADLRGEEVAVLGGGEAAADAALHVAGRGAGVTLFVRGRRLKAAPALASEVAAAALPVCLGWTLQQVEANGDGLRLFWRTSDGLRETSAHRLLVAIGRERRDELLRQLQLPAAAAASVETAIPGLFLAGDLLSGHERFAATAIGDGQRAARLAARFLEKNGATAPATTGR